MWRPMDINVSTRFAHCQNGWHRNVRYDRYIRIGHCTDMTWYGNLFGEFFMIYLVRVHLLVFVAHSGCHGWHHCVRRRCVGKTGMARMCLSHHNTITLVRQKYFKPSEVILRHERKTKWQLKSVDTAAWMATCIRTARFACLAIECWIMAIDCVSTAISQATSRLIVQTILTWAAAATAKKPLARASIADVAAQPLAKRPNSWSRSRLDIGAHTCRCAMHV